MVRHDAAHALAAAARGARGRVVHGLPEPEAAREAQRAEPPQIAHRRLRLHGEGQKARVRRDDKVRLHSPPERQRGAAVGLVAVAQRRVEREKRALGLAPWLAVRHVPALDVEAKARALIEQAVPAQRQEELRHEIFEHRARPAGHAAVAVLGHEGAGELAPVPPRHVAARHGEIAREPRLAREQVIEPVRELASALVPADAEEAALSVIERRELHRVVERAGARGEVGPRVIGHAAAQHGEAGCEVAAVHGGDVLRQQRAQSARVVPVIEVAAPLGQPFAGREDVLGEAGHLRHGAEAEVRRRERRDQCEADIRGRGAVRKAGGRLLLPVVGREIVVFRRAEGREIGPDLRRLAQQEAPVGLRQGRHVFLGPAQARHDQYRDEPGEPEGPPRGRGREYEQRQTRDRDGPGLEPFAGPALALRGGLPGEEVAF